MDPADVKVCVNLLIDEQFETRTRKDILAGVAIPYAARGYSDGPRSLFITAIDQRDTVVACASGALLEHSTKPPLLYIVSSTADPPHVGQGLEYRMVGAMCEAARKLGVAGVWLCDEVAAMVGPACTSEAPGAADRGDAAGNRWWRRLWPRKPN